MNLFESQGLELPRAGRGARPAARRFTDLFNRRVLGDELWLKLVDLAEHAAHRALTDPHDLSGPLAEWAYRWRAEHLGPECAAADKAKRTAFGR